MVRSALVAMALRGGFKMVSDIFPKKPENSRLSDRDWETDCMMVWCNNSLNAWEGYLQHILGDPRKDLSFENKLALQEYLHRAQSVIWFLLGETGRIQEYKEHVDGASENGYGNGVK
jgi:hypothetical protein